MADVDPDRPLGVEACPVVILCVVEADGGDIPEEDQALLRDCGVARIFTMGADTREIIDYLEGWRAARDGSRA